VLPGGVNSHTDRPIVRWSIKSNYCCPRCSRDRPTVYSRYVKSYYKIAYKFHETRMRIDGWKDTETTQCIIVTDTVNKSCKSIFWKMLLLLHINSKHLTIWPDPILWVTTDLITKKAEVLQLELTTSNVTHNTHWLTWPWYDLNKGQCHSFWYQSILYDFLYAVNSRRGLKFALKRTRLATIHSAQTDGDRRSSISATTA